LLETLEGYGILCGNALLNRIHKVKQTLQHLTARVRHPRERLQQRSQQLDQLEIRLRNCTHIIIDKRASSLQKLGGMLNMVSPLATLQRGYAIALNHEGQAVHSSAQVSKGDTLQIQVHDGKFNTRVE
jgi:exodeoxyribonuclease VII large subunit